MDPIVEREQKAQLYGACLAKLIEDLEDLDKKLKSLQTLVSSHRVAIRGLCGILGRDIPQSCYPPIQYHRGK